MSKNSWNSEKKNQRKNDIFATMFARPALKNRRQKQFLSQIQAAILLSEERQPPSCSAHPISCEI